MTTDRTDHHAHATWRTGVVRARLHLGSVTAANEIDGTYGTKPNAMAAFPAATTRRGAPPPRP